MSESELERKIGEYCRKQGLLYYKFSSPSMRGVPDRIIVGPGKVMFLELKAKGKKPTKLQQHHLQKIRSHSVEAHWIDNYDGAVALINSCFDLLGAR